MTAAVSLKDRLKTLKRQAGQASGECEPGPVRAAPFADRVGRLRLGDGNRSARLGRLSVDELAAELGGERIEAGLIRIETRLPLNGFHGNMPLLRLVEDHDALPEALGFAPEQAVFFDTETTGLSGGAGTVVFLLGMAQLDGSDLLVRQYLITAFASEGSMLEDAGEWVAGKSALVSFNGKSFDLPLLTSRARLLGLSNPFAGFSHLDLLHPTRRAFGRAWLDCRLSTVERELLGFARVDDLPGAEAPAAWFAFLHHGDHGRLPGVARHNHWDIVTVAALLPALADAHREPLRYRADPLAVARARLKSGQEAGAYELLRQAAGQLDDAGLLELAWLHRKRGEWTEAHAIWESLADSGCTEAIERLAKYYEHEAAEYGRALGYARRLPASPQREHRCRRLEERLKALTPGPAWDGGTLFSSE